VIQGKYRGRTIALGFALMKRRRRLCYRELFRSLATRYMALTNSPLMPRLVVTDFEVYLSVNITIFYILVTLE
jgi:hypothetical protein